MFFNNLSCIKPTRSHHGVGNANSYKRFAADIGTQYCYIIIEVVAQIITQLLQGIGFIYFDNIANKSNAIDDLIFLQQFIPDSYQLSCLQPLNLFSSSALSSISFSIALNGSFVFKSSLTFLY